MNFTDIQFSIFNFKVIFNMYVPDYLVFGQNLSHILLVRQMRRTHISVFSKDTFIIG